MVFRHRNCEKLLECVCSNSAFRWLLLSEDGSSRCLASFARQFEIHKSWTKDLENWRWSETKENICWKWFSCALRSMYFWWINLVWANGSADPVVIVRNAGENIWAAYSAWDSEVNDSDQRPVQSQWAATVTLFERELNHPHLRRRACSTYIASPFSSFVESAYVSDINVVHGVLYRALVMSKRF